MENNIKNKAKFYCLYYDQRVLRFREVCGFNDYTLWSCEPTFANDTSYLELTPLSQISDEDAIEVAKVFNIGHLKRATISLIKSILSALDGSTPKSETTEFVLNWLTAQDYLRSKGYALPFHGLSIETLVEYGWIKLK